MTVAAFLADLRVRGVDVGAEGGGLRVEGPDDVLNENVLAQLKARKAEIFRHLQALRDPAHATPSVERDHTAARLRELYAGLTAQEQERLAAEADTGDPLAHRVLALIEGRAPEATPA